KIGNIFNIFSSVVSMLCIISFSLKKRKLFIYNALRTRLNEPKGLFYNGEFHTEPPSEEPTWQQPPPVTRRRKTPPPRYNPYSR
ncbi:MAG: hypothetical protein FWC53_02110, partial [Firmicutes bacterium]|nr:hypothetical protein [Bacillota bacterium]